MSDGRKAMAEEAEQAAFDEHAARIRAMSPYAIAETVEKLRDCIRALDDPGRSATRREWAILGEMQVLIKKLS